MNFNSVTGVFNSTITVDTNIQAPTIIHAYKNGTNPWYKDGVDVTLTGEAKKYATVTETDNQVQILVKNLRMLNGKPLNILIEPKQVPQLK